jgi:hypothetical protein
MATVEPTAAIAIFEALGFDAQAITFERVFADPYFRGLIPQLKPTSDIAKILCYSPTLFAMHRDLEPAKGALMIRVFNQKLELSEDEFTCYSKYYPKKLLLVVQEKRSLSGQWFLKGNWRDATFHVTLVPLRKLLLQDVGISVGKAEQKKLADLGIDI